MDKVGKIEQRVGDDLSEGAQHAYRKAVSGGRASILRSRAAVLGGAGGTADSTKSGTRKWMSRKEIVTHTGKTS